MSNPFENYGEAATVAPVRRQQLNIEKRRDAKIAQKGQAELDEKAILLRRYNAWVRERREEIFAGPLGKEFRALAALLRTMTPSSAPALIKFIENAAWIRMADADTRHEVLAMVSNGITQTRLNAGLPPFDDALPGEADNAFLVIRNHIQNVAT